MSGQNEISDGAYVGSMQSGRYDGLGVYKYPDGTRYEGNFKNGLFHGTGKFVFANGVYEGTFKNGKEIEGEYVFNDGLKYKDQDWSYLVPSDRRYYTETEGGIPPAGALQRTNTETPELPSRCFDVGNGMYYDPKTENIHNLATRSQVQAEIVQELNSFVQVRTPSEAERSWIEERCRQEI